MSYNSFTKNNKLQLFELVNGKQSNSISLLKWVEIQRRNRSNSSQPRNANIARLIQFDTEWELMESNIDNEIWKNWSISIGEFNQNWINNFFVEIIFKNGINGDGDSSEFYVSASSTFKKFIGWDIKDIEGQETSNLKNISLVVSIYSNLINQPIFYSKLLVRYLDQSNLD